MRKLLVPVLAFGLLVQCSDDEDQKPQISAPEISNLRVDDITNAGNGSDLEISFAKVEDESLISEYRVLVVKSTSKSSFDISKAEAVLNAN